MSTTTRNACMHPPLTLTLHTLRVIRLLLRSRLVGENDLRRRPSGKGGRKAEKNVKRFYEEQNEHIERLLKPIHAHGQDDDNDRQDNALKVKIAVYGSFVSTIAYIEFADRELTAFPFRFDCTGRQLPLGHPTALRGYIVALTLPLRHGGRLRL